MALPTITPKIDITGLAQAISRTIPTNQEIITQVQVTIGTGTTNYEFSLGILDVNKVKILALTTTGPITYSFTSGGTTYNLTNMVSLNGGSVEAFQELESSTGGTLVVGQQYYIKNFVAGDDFTNAGAPSNATNVSFVATDTTPTTWTNSSELITRPKELLSLWLNYAGATSATVTAVIVTSND